VAHRRRSFAYDETIVEADVDAPPTPRAAYVVAIIRFPLLLFARASLYPRFFSRSRFFKYSSNSRFDCGGFGPSGGYTTYRLCANE